MNIPTLNDASSLCATSTPLRFSHLPAAVIKLGRGMRLRSSSISSQSAMSSSPSQSTPPSPTSLGPLQRGTACLACRKRKQKCSGERPLCQQCAIGERVVECVWDPRPLTKDEKLELRVHQLEALLREQTLKHRSSATSPPPSQTARRSIPPAPSPSVVDHLLEVFLAHAFQFNFPFSVTEFRRSLRLPLTDLTRPHPALVNAMCLLACRWSSDQGFAALEPYFLNAATELLDQALSMVDRLLDFIVATCLISQYSFCVGQDTRGIYLATSATTFALSCGLHALPAIITSRPPPPGDVYLMLPPDNATDLDRRLHVWWSVFLLDRNVSTTNCLASPIADEAILTGWPSDFDCYENPGLRTLPNVAPSYSSSDAFSERVHLFLKAKASGLLYQAEVLVREQNRQNPQELRNSYRSLYAKIEAFARSLPPITSEVLLPPSAGAGSRSPMLSASALVYNPRLVARHTLLFAYSCCSAAKIQLQNAFSSQPGASVQTARELVSIIRQVAPFDTRTNYLFVMPTWFSAHKILLRERRRLAAAGHDTTQLRQDIDFLSSIFDTSSTFYLGLPEWLQQSQSNEC